MDVMLVGIFLMSFLRFAPMWTKPCRQGGDKHLRNDEPSKPLDFGTKGSHSKKIFRIKIDVDTFLMLISIASSSDDGEIRNKSCPLP